MQISPEQGQLMQLLVKMLGARRTIEIGVFTGYSALAVALALPADGRILACDISDEYTRVGRPYWERAGVAEKIDLVLEPALHTLDARLATGEAGRGKRDHEEAANHRWKVCGRGPRGKGPSHTCCAYGPSALSPSCEFLREIERVRRRSVSGSRDLGEKGPHECGGL